ncbi:MAG TPA: hypothetical protein VJA94_25810 [Candidatus Angelobacter sp.]
MLINWFTVLAQIVNFLVLVALLKHFLWGRLVRAIDQREARIAGELAKAAEKERAAQQQMEQVRALALEQERKCDAMISQARKEADEQHLRLVQKARESVRKLEEEWQEDLERERAAFFKQLRERSANEILTIVRQALADLASSELQQSAIRVFLEKLRSLDPATLRKMAEGEVRSSVALPQDTQQEIRTIVAEKLRTPCRFAFTPDPAIGWGVELRSNGLKIGWSPESYIDALEEKLKDELERRPTFSYRAAAR